MSEPTPQTFTFKCKPCLTDDYNTLTFIGVSTTASSNSVAAVYIEENTTAKKLVFYLFYLRTLPLSFSNLLSFPASTYIYVSI